jgi:thiosulfate/3-mercaptopyruvate sulfurtransferase
MASSPQEAFGPLVDAAWLATHRHDSDVRVIDLRWYLSGKNAADEYAKGHVPGAVRIDLEHDITARKGPGRHPIPGGGQLERAMRRAGVSQTTKVVVYDDAGGSIAARLWFLLHLFGHSRVAVLDGGLAGWTAAGGELSTEVPEYPEGDFTAAPPDSDAVVDKDAVHERDAAVVLIDARAAERYRGESEPIDARPGHIPGAVNAPWAGNLDAGRFMSPEKLRERFAALGVNNGSEAIVYCGSGVTACHDMLAMELAGFARPKLYEGSWSDWARDESLPAAKG